MQKVVFYSWESDLPSSTNRAFIENALRDAVKEIVDDKSIDIEPVIDRDTKGVAGAPDIAATIFGKIAAADIFVADISLVLNGKRRSSPNPNVLIELGYALHALGHERIILVFNEASGKRDKLPFDLKTRRVMSYKAEEGAFNLEVVKTGLTEELKTHLLDAFSHIASKTSVQPIIEIIKENKPSKKIDLRTHLGSVLSELDRLQPPMKRNGGTVEQLIAALPSTENLVVDFTTLVETVVLMDDSDSAKEIFQWFGKVLTKYDPRPKESETTWNADGDFFKILGHELFVCFVTAFIKEGKWKELGDILKGILRVGPTAHNDRDSQQSWVELSEHSPLLEDEGKRTSRMSLHGDILRQRHSNGRLGERVPIKEFTETDFFLYLYGSQTPREGYGDWYPRSILWLSHTPRFILDAEDYPTAIQICHSLGISDVDELKRRISFSDRLQYARFSPIHPNEIDRIGSKGGVVIIQ